MKFEPEPFFLFTCLHISMTFGLNYTCRTELGVNTHGLNNDEQKNKSCL